jgi:hypothetical protein
MEKLSPGQVRMYCRVASAEYIESNFRRHGHLTSMFYANTPLGINKLKDLMAQGAKIMGIPPNFRLHALRAVGVTKLANDSSISDAERCRAARHTTVNASRAYQTVDGRSEANRLKALGVTLPTAPMPVPLNEVEERKKERPPSSKAMLKATPARQTDAPKKKEKELALTQQSTESDTEYVDLAAEARNRDDSSVSSENSTDLKLSIHRKKKEAAVPSMTQEDLAALQKDFQTLQGLIENKGRSSPKVPEPPISMTQVGIQDLRKKIEGLQDLVRGDVKPPALSENQLAIRELQKKVKDLTEELEHKELYCDSLENDYFKDVKNSKEFENLAYQKRKLERENKELMDYIARDKKRENWRSYKRY